MRPELRPGEIGVRAARGSSGALREQSAGCGAHPGLYGPFVILSLPEPNTNLVWLENPKNSVYLETAQGVANYTALFDRLRACALGSSEARTRIAEIAQEHTA